MLMKGMPLANASLDTLPPEIIENILILAAGSGDSSCIASIAATCKHLFSIVYRATDRHLWRSLFRTTFDDPRSLPGRPVADADFDWRGHFQDREWARRFVAKHAQPLVIFDEGFISRRKRIYAVGYLQTSDDISHARALRSLLSVIHTSVPATSHPPHTRIAPVQTDQTGARRPVPLVQLHRQTGTWPPEVAPVPYSENVRWLRDTLVRGLPSTLTATFVLQWANQLAQRRWYTSQAGLDFMKLTAHLGLFPIPTAEGHQTSAGASPSALVPRGPRVISDRRAGIDMSEDAQRTRALALARERAFNMDYLQARRNWGPYLRVRWPDHGEDEGGDEGADDTDESDDDFELELPPPLPHKLLPNWSWLAAARVVAESVLRANQPPEDVQRLRDWNNLREGAWLLPETAYSAAARSGSEPEGRPSGEAFERDWAGVEGVWRRLVCWFAYHDLIGFNGTIDREPSEYSREEEPDYEEAWIIVPLSLRITGYSACPIPEYADRPTIHVEGEMGGAEWLEEAADAGLVPDPDVRRVHGTVSMLADGNVRWSITSMNEDNTEDQWASEAIQLGGVGSAMGSLGMWTGVNHEPDDPLGVIWQWRVG
ncbi:hypothetical protein FKP32DRAFT_800490 [Trametes sanguinea]|nr:hypothetical protein FKP32DRAFT_800490 [Trametes sanguinea]